MGESEILEEAINAWLKDAVPEILEKEASTAIALPRVEVTKAVPGNPVNLSLKIPLRPNLILPDYKELAKDVNKKKEEAKPVSDKEIDEAIMRLRQYAAKAVNPEKKDELKEEELPPLNDQFAEAVGGGKTVAELKERIKKDLSAENENRVNEKNRLAIIDAILKKTEGNLPEVLIEHEIDKMEAEFESDVEKMGLKVEDYLRDAKKTREELVKDWRSSAEKRAKVNIILAEIRQKEKLEPEAKEVDHETEHMMEHYKDANKENVKAYVTRMLSNQKVFEWLESQK
jgi:FKBP-type peptidyl-prolyl cis-trans isomerase (trigger factor)